MSFDGVTPEMPADGPDGVFTWKVLTKSLMASNNACNLPSASLMVNFLHSMATSASGASTAILCVLLLYFMVVPSANCMPAESPSANAGGLSTSDHSAYTITPCCCHSSISTATCEPTSIGSQCFAVFVAKDGSATHGDTTPCSSKSTRA